MNFAIIGASGNVGRKTIEILEKSKIPFKELYLVASKKSAGKKIKFRKKEIIIEDYLLTNKFYMGPIVNEDWRDTTSETLRPLFEARVNYIDAAFTEIFNKYSSIEDFVITELNIESQTIDLIKSKIFE